LAFIFSKIRPFSSNILPFLNTDQKDADCKLHLGMLKVLLVHWYSTDQNHLIANFFRHYSALFMVRLPCEQQMLHQYRPADKIWQLHVSLELSKYATIILYALANNHDFLFFQQYLQWARDNKIKFYRQFLIFYEKHKEQISTAIQYRLPRSDVRLPDLDCPGGPLGYLPLPATQILIKRLVDIGIQTAGDFRNLLSLPSCLVESRLPEIERKELQVLAAAIVTIPPIPKIDKPIRTFDSHISEIF
jgi:hypothetical protein